MRTLVLENVRCFERMELPLDRHVTVVIGENGAGKTTLAEAIASLCAGDEGLDTFPLRRGATAGAVRILSDEGALAAWESEAERRRLPDDAWVFAYGRYRRVLPPAATVLLGSDPILRPEFEAAATILPWVSNPESAARSRRTITLTRSDNRLLHDLAPLLVELDAKRSTNVAFARVWERFDRFVRELPGDFEGVRVVDRDDEPVAVLAHGEAELELRELSDGYQAVLVILLDLLLRYAHLFPTLPDPFEGEALVVVDEVDLHLHPRWQRVVIRQLRGLFPRTRFLLTTHSFAVVQSAIDDGHDVVVLHPHGDAVRGRVFTPKERKRLEHADLASVAVEDRLFDLPSRYSPEVEELEKEAARLRRRVAAGGDARERRKLAKKLEDLQAIFARDEERRGEGGFLAEVAKSQMAVLRRLNAAVDEEEA